MVDDEEVVRRLCRRLLQADGCDCVEAAAVSEGLGRIEQESRLDLLVVDLALPDGKGTEVIAAFLGRFPRGRVLLITGSACPRDCLRRLRGLPVGEADILGKPFDVGDFHAAVTARLTRSEPEQFV